MSLDRKRWALIAQELKFSQLDTARKQADAWRNGLAALTALLTAILVLKGRDDVSALPPPFRITAVVLLGVALGLLVAATLLITRALAGPPGEEILLTGEDLRPGARTRSARSQRPCDGLHGWPLPASSSWHSL